MKGIDMTITTIIKRVAAPLLAAALLVSCAGGAEKEEGGHDSHGDHGSHDEAEAGDQTIVPAREVIDTHRGGATASELLEWVNDESRTFDLVEADLADLMDAGVPDSVVNAMLARSDEHQAAMKKNFPGDGHAHSHDE